MSKAETFKGLILIQDQGRAKQIRMVLHSAWRELFIVCSIREKIWSTILFNFFLVYFQMQRNLLRLSERQIVQNSTERISWHFTCICIEREYLIGLKLNTYIFVVQVLLLGLTETPSFFGDLLLSIVFHNGHLSVCYILLYFNNPIQLKT